MRKVGLLTVLLFAGFASVARAQDSVRVLPESSNTSKLLYSYLQAEAAKHFDARRKVVAKTMTPEAIAKRQADLRAKFIDALGGFPEKTPLNGKVTGTIKGKGFRVENVVYESRPNHHVTANLYIPDGKGPFPGVLIPCGHSSNGKAAIPYQRAAALIAMNGMVAMCYDPIGQGERLQLLTDNGKPGVPGSTSEHTMVGVGALLVGKSCATYRIWDGLRSMDYLASRPEVDAKKLGCTGNSGGGTMTSYLMALDERIWAAAPSCYLTTLEKLFDTLGPQDAEQNIPGQVAFGMEHADYITLRAPRPTIMLVATYDFFNIDGAWTTFREASKIYSRLGHGERVALFEYEDKHGFSRPRREAAMRWMRRWLLNIDDAPAETDFPNFTDAQLQCTRSGQVLEDYKGVSAFHLNARESVRLTKHRAKNPLPAGPGGTKIVRDLLGMPASVKIPQTLESSNWTTKREGCTVTKKIYNIDDGIAVPALLFQPTPANTKGITIYIDGAGFAAKANVGGALEKMCREKGHRVLALDLRGFGETRAEKPRKHWGSDFRTAFLAQHLGRPLLGQRVVDVQAVLNTLKGAGPIHLIGVGSAGPVALHVAALDKRISSLTLENCLASWSNVAENPISVDQLTNVVPGVLEHYDLPELAGRLAPLPVIIRTPRDGSQQPLTSTQLEEVFRATRTGYADSKTKLTITP